MGRTTLINKMLPEHQVRIDELVRRYRYSYIDLVRGRLEAEGIEVSRNTLYRHMKKLRTSDSLKIDGQGSTIIVIIGSQDGSVMHVRSSARPDVIVGAIGNLGAAEFRVSSIGGNDLNQG